MFIVGISSICPILRYFAELCPVAISQSSADQRVRLAMSTERLYQAGDKIKDSKRNLLETEDLGVSILQDLHQQRQVLMHSRDTVSLSSFHAIVHV